MSKKIYTFAPEISTIGGADIYTVFSPHLLFNQNTVQLKHGKMIQDLENEVWKPVVGFEGKYMVSNLGRVKSLSYLRKGKEGLLSLIPTKNGYLFTSLTKNNITEHYLIHRLVYEAFYGILPPFKASTKGNERMEVNHINEIKEDNRLENLELISCTQNNNHGTHKQKIAAANSKKVYQYTMDGILVKEWNGTKSCQEYGFSQSAVSACCRNCYCHRKRNDYKGYIWSFTPIEK